MVGDVGEVLKVCVSWLRDSRTGKECKTYTGRPRVILSFPPGAPRL
jgi:hypothetical protein